MHRKQLLTFVTSALCLLLVLNACSASVTTPSSASIVAAPSTTPSSSTAASTTPSSTPVTSAPQPSSFVIPPTSSDGKAAAFYEMFSGGAYHMKAKMIGSDGMETTMETYTKDGMYASILAGDEGSTHMIIRDEQIIMIMDDQKMYMILSSAGDTTGNSGSDLVEQDMSLSGTGTAEFAGKKLEYEEYSGEEGSKTQFFFEGDSLVGVRNIGEEYILDVIILELDSNVPDDVFEIPAGYKPIG